ncbi:MAG: choice-of-anchor J domain-containing protein, partial [candidate division WOR-3 bacterium]
MPGTRSRDSVLLFGLLAVLAGGLQAERLNESFYPCFPPEGWRSYDLDSGYCGWNRDTTHAYPPEITGDGCAQCFSENGAVRNDAWLLTPRLIVASGDSLSFYYRAYGAQGEPFRESLEVRISRTGIAPSDFTDRIWAQGFDAGLWTRAALSLSPYASCSVYVAFRGCGIRSKSTRIDSVKGPTIWHPARDVELRRILWPGTCVSPGDSVVPRVNVRNCGDSAVNPFSLSFSVRDSASGFEVYHSSATVPRLSPGESALVNMPAVWPVSAG